jgi:hypothetical protein
MIYRNAAQCAKKITCFPGIPLPALRLCGNNSLAGRLDAGKMT